MTSQKFMQQLIFVFLAIGVTVPLSAQTSRQIEPNAGNWRTWVISSAKDIASPRRLDLPRPVPN